eukprot:GHVL01032452.1.p1 GENE.GHVL01032452.1~~GHVL01032452.1.p1  ORF type:complete len:184 (+),score=14.27 GHVL01032452.1:239-790(+)
MEDIVLFLTSFVFVLLLCGVQCTELCYTDPNSNTGVYCSNNCCGSYPQIYCCDKDEFITQSAVFGGVAVVFIVVLVTCIVVRKVKKKPEVDPLAAMKKPRSNSVGPIVSVVPENDDPSAAKAPSSEDQHQPSPQAPISTITVVSPPSYDQAVQLPSEAMSDDRVYPSPATPGSPKPTPSSTPR